jgi:CubicO group peptidase (beta-lactamase class C family)
MINANGHLYRRPLLPLSKEEREGTFHSGGAGCFARPAEYCQIIAMLLNDGTHAPTGAKILKPETIKEMFTNQIPEMPNFGRQAITPAKPELSNALPELYPQPHDQAQGWGLTFFLHVHPGPTGRSGSTGWWAGLPNLFWWADRENGLGGIIASQIIPFGDMKVMGLWAQIEAGLYTGIKGQ